MGQSIKYNIIDAPDNPYDLNSHFCFFADFAATVGYRFKQKKGFPMQWNSRILFIKYANGTIALLLSGVQTLAESFHC